MGVAAIVGAFAHSGQPRSTCLCNLSTNSRLCCAGQIPASFLWEIRVVPDLANLLDVSLGVSGDFQHPLPTIDYLRTVAKAVGTQIVVCRLDVFDHSGAERLKLAEGLTQVFIGIDFFVSAACLGMLHAIDSVPHN